MELSDKVWKTIREEVERINHGKVIIEVNQSAKKAYVITENRKRFENEGVKRREIDLAERDVERKG